MDTAKKRYLTSGSRLMKAYFDFIYNPVYDFAVGNLNLYRELQEICIDKLKIKDNDSVLCVGLGTGNEVLRIFDLNGTVSITGVDYSRNALQKARRKALAMDKEIKVFHMDARHLEFKDRTFDKVICIHVMDFIKDRDTVTGEIFRVLKEGGRFVITYPSRNEGINMGANIFRDNIRHDIDSGNNPVTAILKSIGQMFAGIVYMPLLFRAKRVVSDNELQTVLNRLMTADYQIQDYPLYNDLIVHGTK
jgi:ubiquinone/menaquinone biosynthesis C-methylase UbiE